MVNIVNPNNDIDLEDKEIEVYSGIDNEMIPHGNFIIEKPPINEEVKAKTSFTGYDYMIKFDTPYVDTNKYPLTLRDYLINLCMQVGLTLGSTSLINENYMILGNPFTSNETCRTVLSAVAQLCGGFAKIGRDNKVYIITLDKENVVEIIDGNNYFENFSKNQTWGEVNSLVIKLNDNVEGENTVIEDKESIARNGLTEIVISGNPFLIDEEQRMLVATELWNNLKGIKYIPFKTSYYGFPYIDSGDFIKILDSKDEECYTFVFNHKFTYNGTFKGEISTTALSKTQTMYKNTNNIKTKFKETEFKVNKIEGEITSVISDVTEQNDKISKVTQTVNELNSKISDIADITTSGESIYGKLEFTSVNQSEPILIKIHPLGTNISYLYPHSNLYPSSNLYPTTRILRFSTKDTESVEKNIDYLLPDDLLYYDGETYDEFILGYDSQTCQVIKRCGYNEDGTVYKLEKEIVTDYEYPKIELTDGDYTVSLLGYDTAYLYVTLMAQNIYTTQFATKAEVSTEISQTAQDINVSVDKKLTNYSTTTEMNTAINVRADSITSSVGKTYATKTELSSAKSEIKQTTDSITSTVSQNYATKTELLSAKSEIKQTTDSITSTVSKKVGNDEVCSVISQSSDEINITSNRLAIASDNFTLTQNGAITCKSAKVTGGTISGTTISLTGGSKSSPKFKVSDDSDSTSILPDRIYMSGEDDGLYINNSSNSNSRAYIYADSKGGGITLGGNASNDITLRGGSSPNITCYGKMYADAYNYNSKESMKKNIEKFNDNALDIVKNSELYRFNYNREKDTDKKHIGFVIGEDYKTPSEIISQDESGIDSYTMISILWKAFQEYVDKTDIQIEELQKQIKEMKGEQ